MNKGLETLQDFMNQTAKWSDETFDNGSFHRDRSIAISHHLQKEAQELTQALDRYFHEPTAENFASVKEELADCQTLIADCSTHFGCNADELITSCWNKLEKNKKRKWGKPDKHGVVEHIK